ncbi:uncharacterized protein G2W53_021692 [Senna tora]|uniref:Uncharacterized protein n=1 Tax=Senna tora TaxID=362788 RepID=A0A834WJT2_9FABA|nr:uncharacterized protein G2W53_021686 [Senna tora]KAF7823548.1 uncharacterized protein G2W53_021692 [Senna tora]
MKQGITTDLEKMLGIGNPSPRSTYPRTILDIAMGALK